MLLRDSPLRAVERAAETARTGALRFEQPGLAAEVLLRRGRLAWATSSRANFSFGRELARQANVDRHVLRAHVESARRQKLPLTQLLTERAGLTEAHIRAALRGQITAALASLDRTSMVRARFLPCEAPLRYDERFTFALHELCDAALCPSRADCDERSRSQQLEVGKTMANVKETLVKILEIDGALGACLVDSQSGMMLGSEGGAGLNLEIAAAGNTEVVRSKRKTMAALGIADEIEDILITLGKQYHLIRPLSSNNALFVYLVLDKTRGNLAMARHQLTTLQRDITL